MNIAPTRQRTVPMLIVFGALGLLTLLSFVLGESEATTGRDARLRVSVLVIGVAAVKIHLVGMHFMELRHAPSPLKIAFHAWIVGVIGLILGTQLLSR